MAISGVRQLPVKVTNLNELPQELFERVCFFLPKKDFAQLNLASNATSVKVQRGVQYDFFQSNFEFLKALKGSIQSYLQNLEKIKQGLTRPQALQAFSDRHIRHIVRLNLCAKRIDNLWRKHKPKPRKIPLKNEFKEKLPLMQALRADVIDNVLMLLPTDTIAEIEGDCYELCEGKVSRLHLDHYKDVFKLSESYKDLFGFSSKKLTPEEKDKTIVDVFGDKASANFTQEQKAIHLNDIFRDREGNLTLKEKRSLLENCLYDYGIDPPERKIKALQNQADKDFYLLKLAQYYSSLAIAKKCPEKQNHYCSKCKEIALLIQDKNKSVSAKITLLRTLLSIGDYQNAKQVLDTITQPEKLDYARSIYIKKLIKKERIHEALNILANMQYIKHSGASYFLLVKYYIEKGNLQRAAQYLTKLSLEDSLKAQLQIMQAYLIIDDLRNAIICLMEITISEANAREPSETLKKAQVSLSHWYMSKRRINEALICISNIQNVETRYQLLCDLINILLELEDYQTAVETLRSIPLEHQRHWDALTALVDRFIFIGQPILVGNLISSESLTPREIKFASFEMAKYHAEKSEFQALPVPCFYYSQASQTRQETDNFYYIIAKVCKRIKNTQMCNLYTSFISNPDLRVSV